MVIRSPTCTCSARRFVVQTDIDEQLIPGDHLVARFRRQDVRRPAGDDARQRFAAVHEHFLAEQRAPVETADLRRNG